MQAEGCATRFSIGLSHHIDLAEAEVSTDTAAPVELQAIHVLKPGEILISGVRSATGAEKCLTLTIGHKR
jgi:hypothetical protein